MDARYHRLARFHGVGGEGVKRLNHSHAVIIGTGALGTQHAETLTRSGVGKITLIDQDIVEESNLSRQTCFTEEDAKKHLPKVHALKIHLEKINHTTQILPIFKEVTSENIEYLISNADIVLDGTDNLTIRMLINDACFKHHIPWVFGSALESYGMTACFNPQNRDQPCLRCLLRSIPLTKEDTCSSVGVIQPILQIISGLQTTESIKYLVGEPLRETLLTFEIWNYHTQAIKLNRLKNSRCETCGSHPVFPTLKAEKIHQKFEMRMLCGGEWMIYDTPIDFYEIEARLLARQITYKRSQFFINVFLNQDQRIMIFDDGRAIIYGEKDSACAKSLYLGLLNQ